MSGRGEYICISCWTSFEGTADGRGLVTCPHCAFVQPVGDEPDATIQSAPPDGLMMRASGSATRSAEPPRTTGRQAVPPSASQALEPLSIESLESLSEPSPPAAPVVSERHSDATARSGATPPPSRSDSVPLTTDAPPSDGPEVEAPVWRVKSDSGLTYCFFSAERLIRWVDGLGPQKHAMVSVDGVNWKAYSDFHGKFEGDVEARLRS